ncbi:MAG: hypothetical protein WA766_14090 [Candidatus Acidiferrales bacterium]
MKQAGALDHRDRKNPQSREQWEEQKKARNAERGKQKYDLANKTYYKE